MPVPKELEVKNAIIQLLNGCTEMLAVLRLTGLAGIIAKDELVAAGRWFKSVEATAQKWIDEHTEESRSARPQPRHPEPGGTIEVRLWSKRASMYWAKAKVVSVGEHELFWETPYPDGSPMRGSAKLADETAWRWAAAEGGE
jgi:hypothetical protein